MKPFTDRRRFYWLGGVTLLIVGFVAAALLLPSMSDPTRNLGPAVHVPRMQNVPPSDEHMKLDTQSDNSKEH